MAERSLAFLLCGILSGGCAYEPPGVATGERAAANTLRNFAVSLCLRQASPAEPLWLREGSTGAYFELGEFGSDTLAKIEALVATKLAEPYASKQGLELFVMKCLDLGDTDALRELARSERTP